MRRAALKGRNPMKKSKLLLILCLALALTMSLGSTLAYLTDVDSQTNTFTMGKVDIDLVEDFVQDSPLWPGEKTNKDASITNNGATPAWVWMTVVVPANLKDYVTPVWADGVTPDTTATDAEGNLVYTYLVNDKLQPNTSTGMILDAMEMSSLVDIREVNGEDYWVAIVDGVETPIAPYADKLDVTVYAYAVQEQGFDTVDEAYKAYNAQYVQYTEVDTLTGLREAIAAGGYIKLTADITLPAGEIITIAEGVEVTLNLNGQTLNAEGRNDNAIRNNGTLTISNGTVNSERGGNPIKNNGVMTIDGIKVVRDGMAVYNAAAAQMTIKGNSEIKGINNFGSITIEEGSFSSVTVGTQTYIVLNQKGGDLEVKGGTFTLTTGTQLFRDLVGSSATITGGTFSVNPSNYVDTDNYTVTQNDDNTYTVTAK